VDIAVRVADGGGFGERAGIAGGLPCACASARVDGSMRCVFPGDKVPVCHPNETGSELLIE